MKKFASITIAMLMLVSMMLSSVVSTSARTSATGINGSTKGTITLKKYETDSNKTVPVDGAEFTAYKVMDLVVDADKDATFVVDTDLSGVITAEDLVHTGKIDATGDLYKSTKELEAKIPAIEALSSKLTATKFTATGNNTGEYVASNLTLGVYLVVETKVPDGYIKGSQSFLVSIPEWNGSKWVYSVEAQPKNTPITLQKNIVDPDKNNALVNEAVFPIGELVKYDVKAKIPSYGMTADGTKKYSQYIKELEPEKYANLYLSFTDTFSEGLTFAGASTVNVYTDSKTFKQPEGEDPGDYTVKVLDDGRSIEILFADWDKLYEYEGQNITVEYKALVNEKAAIEAPNDNVVKYKFINDPDKGSTEELVDEAYVYSFQMNVTKTFEGKTANAAGVNATAVTFKLYKKGNSTALKLKKNTNGDYTYNEDQTATGLTDTITLSSTGTLTVKGLEEGTYLFEETKTVSGYAIPTTQIEIKLDENAFTATGNDYQTIGVTPVHCANDGTSNPLKLVEGCTNTFELTVNNVIKQFTLPTTGGDGILFFTIAGGILMAAAIILFTTLRKKSSC